MAALPFLPYVCKHRHSHCFTPQGNHNGGPVTKMSIIPALVSCLNHHLGGGVLLIIALLNVQHGPKLQSSVQVFAQSRTLYSLWYPPPTPPPNHHPPTTENFLQSSRHITSKRFGIQTSHKVQQFCLFQFGKPLPAPLPKKNPPLFQNKVKTKEFSKLSLIPIQMRNFL